MDGPPFFLGASDGVDRLSSLPYEIRSAIVSRLPINDGARTAILSSSWRKLWLSTPLVLMDEITPSPPSAMDGRRPFTNVDPETEAELRRTGCDPHKVDQATECRLSYIYSNLPRVPLYEDRQLPPVSVASDGVDRISYLPDQTQHAILYRLPIKDAARTAVLSSRWRKIWSSTPLVLIDAHLLPKRQSFCPTPADSPAITAVVSSILEAHPGPFKCVHLVCSHMSNYLPQLERWLQIFADKGVQELVFVNRPWPHDVPLPATVFSISILTRLYLGQWKFPDMTTLGAVSLPCLRELGICCVFMKHGDVDNLLDKCPELEILNILGDLEGLRLRLVSRTLRCVQICHSKMEDIAVVQAPCLERLVLYGSVRTTRGTRVRIFDAPKLRSFGYLEPGHHVLETHDPIIMPGKKVSTYNMLSSVKVLSLNVRFGVRKDVQMVPTFLRCFPNVKILHIKCQKCDKPTGYHNLDFWKKSGPIKNVVLRIKELSMSEFRGEKSAYFFLEFFTRTAQVLKVATIILPNPCFTPCSKDVIAKMKKLAEKSASKASVAILCSNGPLGGPSWNIQAGGDLSLHDPFSFV